MDKPTIDQRENSMVNFMDEVNKHKQSRQSIDNYNNSVDVRRKVLNKKKSEAKGICLDLIFDKIYKDALPMNDEYKVAHSNELDSEFNDFISDKAPQGLEYYVKESIKKGNKAASYLMESVEKLVREAFFETSMNLEDVDPDTVEFDPDSEENQAKIKEITDTMGTEDISDIIKQNVKQSAIADIEKTKNHEEEMKNIVDELKNDPKITNESTLDRRLRLMGIGTPEFYQPTLFEGIMINRTTHITESVEDLDDELVGKKAFIESVKELTKLNVLHALGLETITMESSKKLAKEYAQMKTGNSPISFYHEGEQVMDDPFLVEEGANLEIRKIFKDKSATVKVLLKDIHVDIKDEKYSDAKAKIAKAKQVISKMADEIRKVESTTGSVVFSWLLSGELMFIGRRLLSMCIPFGFIAETIDEVTKRWEVAQEEIDKRGESNPKEDFNLYKNGILVRLKEYNKTLDLLAKGIDKRVAEAKK